MKDKTVNAVVTAIKALLGELSQEQLIAVSSTIALPWVKDPENPANRMRTDLVGNRLGYQFSKGNELECDFQLIKEGHRLL